MSFPSTFGKYQIEREVGRGGFAVVYQAHDPSLGRRVAIKVPHAWLLTDTKFVERFRREARLAANLTHPHIVTIYEIGEEQVTPFIAMEWLEGMPLSRWLTAAKPPPLAVLQALLGVGAALDYAHGFGVVHRDIKPSNIMMVAGRGGVLTDFGIARLAQATPSTSGVMGTPNYMAPEVLKGQPATAAADIYALGVMLYEVMAGRPPFQGEPGIALAYQHVNEPPPDPRSFNPALPSSVAHLLVQALAKEPGQRPAKAETLTRGLMAGFGGGAPSAMESSITSKRRQSLPFLGGGALLIVVLLILTLTLASRLSPQATRTPNTIASDLIVTRTPIPLTPSRVYTTALTVAATPTPSPTLRPVSTVTPAIIPAFVIAADAVNVRSGPATSFGRIGQVRAGQQYAILARNDAGDWWQFDYGDGKLAWILASLTVANVAPSDVRVAEVIPPTYTPMPTSFAQPSFLQLYIPGNNTRSYWSMPTGRYDAYGVPFVLGSDPNAIWTSQADDVKYNPTMLELNVNERGISQMHLLYNGGDTYTQYLNNYAIDVKLVFDDGAVQSIPLIVGKELRDYRCETGVICQISNPSIRQVWGDGQYSVDMLSIPIAVEHRSKLLTKVLVEDVTMVNNGLLSPAINVIAVTLER